MLEQGKKRKVLFIAGSRGEYGYFRPIIRAMIADGSLEHEFVVCNMHPLFSFGRSMDEIERDGFNIGAVMYNTLDGYNRLTMVKSLGIFALELPGTIDRLKPDIILVAGDRGEQLMAAIVGAHLYIPVAHIQAGELSGNIDGTTRHAITKFAHIHFAANDDAVERLRKMGEEEFRIHNVGAPQLDELVDGFVTPREEIYSKFKLVADEPIILLAQHSITEEYDQAEKQMEETLRAINHAGLQTVVILNNSDAGSRSIRSAILKMRTQQMRIHENVSRQDYAGLMNVASVLVGNSSSGVIEAPLFKLPVLNIGKRQLGRMQSTNVINVSHNAEHIEAAISTALSEEFRVKAQKCASAYGDGRSSKKIVDILKNVPIDDRLLIKRLTY